MGKIITELALDRRAYWVEKIRGMNGNFSGNSEKLEKEISNEIKEKGVSALIEHLRLCGNIPESYGHDSTEEKLYSKYTDILLAESFKSIGIKSVVLRERADAADVEAFAKSYSFVADAKSFRLSRTAKNQKDFKIQPLDRWKHGKPYAIVVCPIYQLPNKTSQIYQQAIVHNICIFTYSHLSMIVLFSHQVNQLQAENLLHEIFKIPSTLHPSKDASNYWLAINKTMLNFSGEILDLWKNEKISSLESVNIAKQEALRFLANEREKIMMMNHEDALIELVRLHKIESKKNIVESISSGKILEII